MKASELMIGDWVFLKTLDRKEVKQVTGVYAHGCCKHGYVQVKNIDCSAEYLEPIPLTPEILVANGFEMCTESPYRKEFDLNLPREDAEYDFFCVDLHVKAGYGNIYYNPIDKMDRLNFIAKPLYVHHLQHALRECGIDKEIKLKED